MPFLNVYIENRSYGGPEEGGWWYDTGEVYRSIPCTTFKRAKRAKTLVDRWCKSMNDSRNSNLSSCLCEGRFVCCIEKEPPKDYPQEKPFYS